MITSEVLTDKRHAAQRISSMVEGVRQEGRRVLVVVGAGCSYAAGMPLMKGVYAYLRRKLMGCQESDKQLGKLRDWLVVLEKEGGPRSLAAQALGLFQQPQLLEGQAREFLERTWEQFAADFLTWQVAPDQRPPDAGATILSAKPTKLHKKLAAWVRSGLAVVLSLNFDGLTRKAIEQAGKEEGKNERCVILARREEIDHYFFGETTHKGAENSPLWAVIKARGDVFHASCRNKLCPACQKPAAIYELQREIERRKEFSAPDQATDVPIQLPGGIEANGRETKEPEAALILRCSECGALRHLEISFTGYQRKEEEAEDVLDGIRERVMPGIGGIITVGVSGLWDDALVEMFEKTGRLWNDDDPEVRRIICVDRKRDGEVQKPFLVKRLEHAAVPIIYAPTGAENLADALTVPNSQPICPDIEDRSFDAPFTNDMQIKWVDLLFVDGFKAPPPLVNSQTLRDSTPIERFARIRQLGLKTALVRAPKADLSWDEKKHNRLVHSGGAALIGLAWLNKLLAGAKNGEALGAPQFPASLLKSTAYLACLTHDLSHLPFTHLTEEVFAELHWTTSPWRRAFHHDAGVLDICEENLGRWANATIKEVHEALKLPSESIVLRKLVSRAIEGRSGIAALDAIVNSPIDADKIEYVASDSLWMKQDVHLPIAGPDHSRLQAWLHVFLQDQRLLPSGIIAISGPAAENAYQLLEERRWLYKHLYFRPAFRVIERIVHHLLVRWLTWHVGQRLAGELSGEADIFDRWSRDGGIHSDPVVRELGAVGLGDTRCIKGRAAAAFLWEELMKLGGVAGEPNLALEIARRLDEKHRSTSLKDWYERCGILLQLFLKPDLKPDYDKYEDSLRKEATWSSRMYIRRSDFDKTREIVRNLEYGSEPSALIDLASLPPMLSYPDARRFAREKRQLYADCWAVPHEDPERWGKETGRWVPLGKTALARHDREENRWVQILILSPRPDDRPALQYLEDRLRHECERKGVRVFDEEPQVIA